MAQTFYYEAEDETESLIETSDQVPLLLTDRDLAKIHIAASTHSLIEMANAVSSIDSLMDLLQTRIQNRAKLAEREGSTIEVKKTETKSKIGSLPIRKVRTATEKPKQDYTCDTCGYMTARRGDYNKHILIHSGIKPYHCTLCNYKTTEKCRLNRHMESKLHTGEARVPKKRKLTGNEGMIFTCDQCDYQTTDSADMLAHKSNMHTSYQHIVTTEGVDGNGGQVITLYTVADPSAQIHSSSSSSLAAEIIPINEQDMTSHADGVVVAQGETTHISSTDIITSDPP